MKEKIKKLKQTWQEVVDLMKEWKTEETVKKLEEHALIIKEIEDEAETIEKTALTKSEEIQKKEEKINKNMELIEKFVSMNISADDILKMKEMPEAINKLTERVESMEKAKSPSQQIDKKEEKQSEDKWPSFRVK